MTTTTIEDGYLYVTDVPSANISDTSNTFTDTGYTVVKIAITSNIKYDYSNDKLQNIPYPDSTDSYYVDVKMYKEAITCQGELWSKTPSGSNDVDTALEKFNNLRTLATTKDTVVFVYGTYNATKSNRRKYSGTISKMMLTEPYGDSKVRHHTWSSGVVVPHRLPIQIQLLLGSSAI